MRVQHVEFTVDQQSAQSNRPPWIGAGGRQAVTSHAGLFQSLGEVVLVGQHVRGFDVERIVVVGLGRCRQQCFGAAWAQSLDQPEDTDRHGAEDTRVVLPLFGIPRREVGLSCAPMTRPACAG